MFSIDPDAHSTAEIDNLQWGVLMARKGGVPKRRVLNALSLDEFAAFVNERKKRLAARAKTRRNTKPPHAEVDAKCPMTRH
jgi:DNA polymerase (family 10)